MNAMATGACKPGSSVRSASRKSPYQESNPDQRLGPTMSSIRVLVVEDFAPFRQFIRSRLQKMPDLQVICEVPDGLEAIQRAEELEPDLVLLDINVHTLNGFEAARQIRKRSPESKIIFVSQVTSPEAVLEALNLGAWGYVVKTHAATDLLTAVEAVLENRHFVGAGLSGQQ
jgi:DNA-binding NarL/FixJ family response regulator